MPVTDFECQIARGQIGRYLGGTSLSTEAMRGLEDHLAECPECKALVSDRRAALLGMLGGSIPTQAVVSMPVKEEENPLVAALRAKQEAEAPVEKPKSKSAPRYAKATKSETPTGKPVLTKPIILGGVLAVVLLGMNFMTRSNNGKGAFGDRAADAFADKTLAAAPAQPKTDETKTPETKTAETKAPEVKTEETKPIEAKIETKPVTTPAIAPEAETDDETNADSTETPKAPVAGTKPAAAVKPVETKPVVQKPIEHKPIEAKPTVQKPVEQKPVAEKPVVAPKHVAKKIVHRAKRTVRKARVKRAAPHGSVRVYGLDGRPIK